MNQRTQTSHKKCIERVHTKKSMFFFSFVFVLYVQGFVARSVTSSSFSSKTFSLSSSLSRSFHSSQRRSAIVSNVKPEGNTTQNQHNITQDRVEEADYSIANHSSDQHCSLDRRQCIVWCHPSHFSLTYINRVCEMKFIRSFIHHSFIIDCFYKTVSAAATTYISSFTAFEDGCTLFDLIFYMCIESQRLRSDLFFIINFQSTHMKK